MPFITATFIIFFMVYVYFIHCNANFRLNNHFGLWHTVDVSAPEGMSSVFCILACLFLRIIGFRYVNLWQIKHPVQRFNIFNFRNRSRNRMR